MSNKLLTFKVVWSHGAAGSVAVAKAGRATKVVVHVNFEVSRLATITVLSFNILLALALARGDVAIGLVSLASLHHALAGLAAGLVGPGEGPVTGLALRKVK